MVDYNCSELPPSATQVFEEISGLRLGLMIGGIACTVITIVIFIEELVKIKRHLATWNSKRKVVFILGVFPVVAVTSMAGIMVPRASMLVDLVASVYISSCLLLFLRLTVDYFGGYENMTDVLEGQTVGLNQSPFLCCCPCLPRVNLTRRNIGRIEMLVGQNALIKPFLVFTIAVLWSDGIYVKGQFDPNQPYLYMTILNFVSTFSAMFGLKLAFAASKTHLKQFRISVKFFCINSIILLTNLQSIIFNILSSTGVIDCSPPFNSTVRGEVMNHLVLIVEMLLLSLLARCSFRFIHESHFARTREREFTDISIRTKM